MKPYFEQGGIRVFCGDARTLLATLDVSEVGCVLADPPYGETSLAWDRWPDNWPVAIAQAVPENAPMWCFGSLRMFFDHVTEFQGAGWKYAQDLVWEKHNGSGFATDRFKRVHEIPVQWYRGPWSDVFTQTPRTTGHEIRGRIPSRKNPAHTGKIASASYDYTDERIMRSVIRVPSVHGDADVFNETQKPIGIVEPLIRYSLAPGKVLLDPFCGSGTSLVIAKQLGARAIGIDCREEQCEATARRLTQSLGF